MRMGKASTGGYFSSQDKGFSKTSYQQYGVGSTNRCELISLFFKHYRLNLFLPGAPQNPGSSTKQVGLSGPKEEARLVKISDICSSFVSAAVTNTAQGRKGLI